MSYLNTIQEIEKTLREQYAPGFGSLYLGEVHYQTTTPEIFKKDIKLELPLSFYAYYQWLSTAKFEYKDIPHLSHLVFDDFHYVRSLNSILDTTKSWQAIKEVDPACGWKSGFVEIVSWDSCYVMVIDTLGEVGEKGNMLYWDFKGGETYHILYPTFELFLKTNLEKLKQNLYFPPPLSDPEQRDDFYNGDKYRRRTALENSINGAYRRDIDFLANKTTSSL